MPCYEPPPPWGDAQRTNAEQAARLLCSQVGLQLDNDLRLPLELLTWYVKHRQIDLQIAQTSWYDDPDVAEAAEALEDIERALKRIAQLQGETT